MTLIAAQSQAAILTLADGELTGAQDVFIEGIGEFDVKFVDGTCVELFSGCDELSDFTFITEEDAKAAVEALFDQVFVDNDLGLFDSDPRLIAGCDSSSACGAIFPFQFGNDFGEYGAIDSDQLFVAGASNRSSRARFGDNYFQIPLDPSITTGNSRVYTIFTRQPVPEPATFALILLGLAGIWYRRSRILRCAWF
jgi:hypothetical protein